MNKTGHGRKSSTTFKITKAERTAFTKHVDALNALVASSGDAAPVDA